MQSQKIQYSIILTTLKEHDMRGSTGGGTSPPPPLKNHKYIGFLSNTGPDLLKNHKATKPAFNVGPPSASQRNDVNGGINSGI